MEEQTTYPFTVADVIALMDKHYTLMYVHYDDNLDHRMKEIQAFIHGEHDALTNIEDYYMDNQFDAVHNILKDLIREVADDYDMDRDEVKKFFYDNDDELREAIYDRDDSNLIGDLVRNTSDPAMFYDTGMEIGDWSQPMDERIADVKEAICIPKDNTEFDRWIEQMCGDAGYGGQLVVYFNGDLRDWINWDDFNRKTITFRGEVHFAIVDHWNGSGGSTSFRHTFTLPYEAKNIFIDHTIKYNYTHRVCGMHRTWCATTIYEFDKGEACATIAPSPVNQHLEIEARYNATFKAGGCTIGDMDRSRHRRTRYENNIPCGSRCLDCGNFWID